MYAKPTCPTPLKILLVVVIVVELAAIGLLLAGRAGASEGRDSAVEASASTTPAPTDTPAAPAASDGGETAGGDKASSEPVTLTVTFAGDCTLGTDINYENERSFNSRWQAEEGDATYFLRNVADLFGSDDLTVVNMEGALTEGGERADERADDGDDCRAADDAHRVDLGDRHNADVLAVGGGRDRTDEAGDHGREVIREQRAVQAGVLEQIAADDLARDELMADVLVRDDEDDRQDDQDGVDVELRRLEVRNGNEAGVQRIDDGLGVDDAGNNARNVAADDRNQDRNGREETAEHDAAEYRNGERHEKGDDRADGHAVADDAAGGSRRAGQLETDERDDRAHGCRRQHDADPVRAAFVDDEREDAAASADCDEAAERVLVAPVLNDDGRGCDEREGRAEVGRRLALGDQDEQQRADAVHEQHDRRVHLEDERHEHGRAEHRKHMLQTKEQHFWQSELSGIPNCICFLVHEYLHSGIRRCRFFFFAYSIYYTIYIGISH